MPSMHDDQRDVTIDQVRRLVDEQFRPWRGLPLREVRSAGTVNAIFRMGDTLAARLPLRMGGGDQARARLAAEAVAARKPGSTSAVPTPEPVASGEPGHGYPSFWSVQTWLPGTVVTVEDPAESFGFAEDLAGFITSLRAADTRGRRFSGSGRGGDLQEHDEWMTTASARARVCCLWDG